MLVANKNEFTTLRLYGSQPHIQNTLSSVLIKDASQYTGTVLSFYTNVDPPIIYNTTPLLYIRPKYDVNDPKEEFYPNHPVDPYTEEIFTFRGSSETSTCELMHNLHRFITKFESVIHRVGTSWGQYDIDNDEDDPGNEDVTFVSCTLLDEMRLHFFWTDAFASLFYFEFTDLGRQVLGFPDKYLYAYMDSLTNDLIYSLSDDAEPLFDGVDDFNLDSEVVVPAYHKLGFTATQQFTHADLRYSLKIEISIPIVGKVFVETTTNKSRFAHKYTVAEYKFKKLSLDSNTMTIQDVVLDTFSSHSQLSGGLSRLGENDNRYFQLHKGEIQAVDTRFIVSYIQPDDTIKDFPLPFDDKFYDLTLLFIKKEDDRTHDVK